MDYSYSGVIILSGIRWLTARGWTVRGSNPGGGEIFRIVQTGLGAHPASLQGTGSLLGVKLPRPGIDHPPHLAPRLKKE